MINDENPLSRWSRRKLQSEQQTLQEDLDLQLQQQGTGNEIPVEGLNQPIKQDNEPGEEQKLLTDADMPDIETLNEGSDFSGFMSPGVSDELRNLALRKLFKAPSFNIRDGLDEYDEDYTSFEKLGDIITCDMKHQMKMEAEKKLREQQEALSALEDSESDTGTDIEEPDLDSEASIEETPLETTSNDENLPLAQSETAQNVDELLEIPTELTTDNKTRDLA